MDKKNRNKDSTKKHSYRYILDTVPIPILEVDKNLIIKLANREALRNWPAIVDGKSLFYQLLPCEEKKQQDCIIEKTFRLKQSQSAEIKAKTGEIFDVTTNYVEDAATGSARVVVHIFDICHRKKTELALERSEEKYRTIFERSPETIVLLDKEGRLLDVNERLSDRLGYKKEDVLGKNFLELPLLPEESKVKAKEIFTRRMLGKEIPPYEIDFVARNGERVIGRVVSTLIKNKKGEITHDLVIVSDVTELEQAEEELRKHRDHLEELVEERTAQIKASLEEKEVLLKEIHHRVKNNLQTVSSLLNIQSGYIKDKQAQEVFTNTRERVQAMALVHEKLYQSKDLSKIDFAEYIQGLVTQLFDSYSLEAGQVREKINVVPVLLNIETAIPLGLIINELVSNSLKHAFPGNRSGELRVTLERSEDEHYDYALIIRDNGVGFPESLDFRHCDTLGMVLVSILVKQLHGVIQLDRNKGTTFTIKFKSLRQKNSAKKRWET